MAYGVHGVPASASPATTIFPPNTGFSAVVVVGASVPRPVVVSGAASVVSVAAVLDVSPASSLPPQAAPKSAIATTVDTMAIRRRWAWKVVFTRYFPCWFGAVPA
ncbi:unannotated protein [freshwater metagenome]|uniref:Unannotated protein n=1 Tax=freshwater metagenome TaxID=449393 RepID=A0A6J6PG04_9ZZZZ